MNTRLVCLGLVAAAAQLFGTGCGFHPIARFRANHPCLACRPLLSPEAHPLLHPIQTRRAILSGSVGPAVGGPIVGEPVGEPVVSGPVVPPCHGCAAPGVPAGFSGGPIEGVPVGAAGYPPIVVSGPGPGGPVIGPVMPINPGATVVPSNQLHYPNAMPPK